MDWRRVKSEVVAALVFVYLLNFLRKFFNLALASLSGLQIYETPTTEYLKQFAISSSKTNEPIKKSKKSGKRGSFASSTKAAVEEELLIERSAPIVLDSRSVKATDLSDYVYDIYFEVLLNLTAGGLVLYFVHELVVLVSGDAAVWAVDGKGLIFFWNGSTALFAVVVMLRLLLDYASHGDTNDTMLALITGSVSMLTTMTIVMSSETFFDFELDKGYDDVSARMTSFCKLHDLPQQGVSLKMIKLLLALSCGGLGMVLTFPTLRFIRCQTGAQNYASGVWAVLLRSNLVLLVLVTISFTKAAREQLDTAGVQPDTIRTARSLLLMVLVFNRLLTFKLHMQNYLNTAEESLLNLQRIEVPKNVKVKQGMWGSSHKIPAAQVQRLVAKVSTFMAGVGVQLLTPVVMLFAICSISRIRGGAGAELLAAQQDDGQIVGPLFYRSFLLFYAWWICVYTLAGMLAGSLWFSFTRHSIKEKKFT